MCAVGAAGPTDASVRVELPEHDRIDPAVAAAAAVVSQQLDTARHCSTIQTGRRTGRHTCLQSYIIHDTHAHTHRHRHHITALQSPHLARTCACRQTDAGGQAVVRVSPCSQIVEVSAGGPLVGLAVEEVAVVQHRLGLHPVAARPTSGRLVVRREAWPDERLMC